MASTTTTSTTWVPTRSRSTTSLHTPHQSLLTDLLVDKHQIKARNCSRLFVCNHLSFKFVPFYKWPVYIHSRIKITDTENSISISFTSGTEEGDFWNLYCLLTFDCFISLFGILLTKEDHKLWFIRFSKLISFGKLVDKVEQDVYRCGFTLMYSNYWVFFLFLKFPWGILIIIYGNKSSSLLSMWGTRPERPKDSKEDNKRSGPPARTQGLEGTLDC